MAHMTKSYDGIAVYTVATNKERIVLKGTRYSEPRFVNAETLSYIESIGEGESVKYMLRQIPVAGGAPKTLFTTAAGINAYSWSPGRTAVAFVAYDDQGLGFYVLNRGGKVELKRRFASQGGRDGTELDDQHVEWSDDGERVLVTTTAAGSPGDSTIPTMFVISKGKDIIAPRVATYGRWISGSEIVYEDFVAPYAWHILNVDTGAERRMAAVPNSARPALWRDRAAMVYDRAGDDRTIHLYSFADGTDRVIASNGAGPTWVATNTVVYSNAAPCTGQECGPQPWQLSGGTKRLVIGSSASAFALTSTLGIDVF